MVERSDLGGQHKRRIRDVGFLRRGRCERRLPLGDDAPTQRSNERARQRRHTFNRRRGELFKGGVHDLEEGSLLQGTLGMRTDPLRVSVTGDDRARARRTHEGPASPRTTMFCGLQDEASIVAVRKLSVHAHRAQLVSEHTPNNRDHSSILCKIGKNIAGRPGLAPLEDHRLTLV